MFLIVLRLRIEGSEEKVRAFLKDFALLPQHKVVATSAAFFDGDIGVENIAVICHFEHYPLEEIHEPISVMFETTDNKFLSFTLLKGNVIRVGDIISVTGKVSPGLLE